MTDTSEQTSVVRLPNEADAPALADLLGQLGYPATAEEVSDRLAHFRGTNTAIALVYEQRGVVVGVVTGHVIRSLHSTPLVAQLTVLVVDRASHGQGIGRLLVEAIEVWARGHGAKRISLTSRLSRTDAHKFYERLGYEKNGARLAKELD